MKAKIVISAVIVIGFSLFGFFSFIESNVEYTNIAGAIKSHKKVQLKGVWNKDRESSFDHRRAEFTFYLIDDAGQECKVVLEGAAPNNFELATSVVAKGRYMEDGYFHATEVLTKCPSKYEAQADEVKKSI
jgi:cytochrome c-type biogenesis protein CcmE